MAVPEDEPAAAARKQGTPIGPDRTVGPDGTRPTDGRDFATAMARFAPFERHPQVAVAVSGGRDSLALCILLEAWCRQRDGRLTALTVDHGLRPESAAEAKWVAARLRRLGIRHRILAWHGAKPTANVQARARAARYEILTAWCRRNRVLHLALAHHLDDQAETVMLRLGRGSGVHGLSAMPAVAHHADVRLIRPMLAWPRARLTATLAARGEDWLEDPSNRDPAFARIRVRRTLATLCDDGLDPRRLADTAAHLGRARQALDRASAALLAETLSLHPFGYAWVDRNRLLRAPAELQLRALADLVTMLAGADYPPRFERLARLKSRIESKDQKTSTLGGCLVVPRHGRLLFAREPKRCPELPLSPGRLCWDGRFAVEVADATLEAVPGLRLAALGEAGLARVRASVAPLGRHPVQALRALPAIWRRDRLLAAPDLGYWAGAGPRGGEKADPGPARSAARAARILAQGVEFWGFAPKNPLTHDWFTVA